MGKVRQVSFSKKRAKLMQLWKERTRSNCVEVLSDPGEAETTSNHREYTILLGEVGGERGVSTLFRSYFSKLLSALSS